LRILRWQTVFLSDHHPDSAVFSENIDLFVALPAQGNEPARNFFRTGDKG
jgi:hypothetical protein